MKLKARDKFFFKLAYGLAVFTIVYNIFEGIFSLYFGLEAESVTLFGFGIDWKGGGILKGRLFALPVRPFTF